MPTRSPISPQPDPPRVRLAWGLASAAMLLAWVGGFVDAVGYLSFYHLFMGFMSGNSIHLGVSLGQGHWRAALVHALPILLFVVGVSLGVVITELSRRHRARSPMARVLVCEALLLAAAIFCGRWLPPASHLAQGRATTDGFDAILEATRPGVAWLFILPVILLTIAMGLQTAALQHVDTHSVHTTFVTGMLTSLGRVSGSRLLPPQPPEESIRERPGERQDESQPAMPSWPQLVVAVWATYVAGAVAGTLGQARWSIAALAVPLAVLLLFIALELWRPLGSYLPIGPLNPDE